MRIRVAVVGLVAVATAALTGCSSSGPDFNDADVTFAQEMIPHHEQATEMSSLAPSRTDNAAVLDLASRIKAAQSPEITAMKGWLKDWGKSESGSEHSGHSSHMDGMEGMDAMPGMMSDAQLDRLKRSKGAAFDQLFLTMMIEHHEGAVAMAKTEQSQGKNADAVDLAETIRGDQTIEIGEMKRLLATS